MNLCIDLLKLTQLQWLFVIINTWLNHTHALKLKKDYFKSLNFAIIYYPHETRLFTVCSHSCRLRPHHFIRTSCS